MLSLVDSHFSLSAVFGSLLFWLYEIFGIYCDTAAELIQSFAISCKNVSHSIFMLLFIETILRTE